MQVRFWGTRGSIPTPGPKTALYGGNTSCVEIKIDAETVLILDCGTGVRQLGQELLKRGCRRIHLLIGHTHWDHIHGFPFFTPASLAEYELNIYAPVGFQRSLEDALAGQMQYSYFPVKLQDLASRIHFTELEEGLFRIGDVLVETQYLNHTAPTIAYRISSGGSTVAYVTDHEPFWNSSGNDFQHPGDQRHIEFLRNADLVIHDAQYTEEEYRTKHGWGHSTVEYATDVAIAAGAARLALFHHDPAHDDDTVSMLEETARARAVSSGSALQVFAAAEGLTLDLDGTVVESPSARVSALARRPIRGGRVLVAARNPSDITDVEEVLSEDGLMIIGATGQTALARAAEVHPDLVILDSRLSDQDGSVLIQSLREAAAKPDLPILIFTDQQNSRETLHGSESMATDYLSHPYSPPMLRSRVRAWLARTMGPSVDDNHTLVNGSDPLSSAASANVLPPEMLGSIELFSSLTPIQLEKILARASQHSYPEGYTVIRQGQPAHSVYVVLSGRVRVTESLPDNATAMNLLELRQGGIFGELGILQERSRSATVVALERTVCLVIPEGDFRDALNGSPDMALGLVRVLARRLLDADRALARYGPDPLTGLPGRRAFHELYKRISAGARRRGNSVLLLAVDVIQLKGINDLHGYKIGDEVLRTVADVLVESTRGTDLVARYGPDEFAALFVEAGAEQAENLIARIQQKFDGALANRGLPSNTALRIGFAVGARPPEAVDDLLRAADAGVQSH